MSHRLPERRTDTDDDGGQDVLITREEKEGGILRVLGVGFVSVQSRWYIPGRVSEMLSPLKM